MDQWLAIEDLTALGLGLDVTGAVILTRGLLLSPAEIVRLGGTHIGWNPHALLGRADDKVKGTVGMSLLLLGFLLQALATFLTLGNVSPDSQDNRHVVVAMLAAAIGIFTGWAIYAAIREPLLKRELVAVYRASNDLDVDGTDLHMLVQMGSPRWPRRFVDGVEEGSAAYCRRVFGPWLKGTPHGRA